MKTKDVLTAPEPQVVPALKAMKIKELERLAKKVLLKLGKQNYEDVIRKLIKAIPGISQTSSEPPFQTIKALIRDELTQDALQRKDDDLPLEQILDRLSVIFMLLISKKFAKIHAENNT